MSPRPALAHNLLIVERRRARNSRHALAQPREQRRQRWPRIRTCRDGGSGTSDTRTRSRQTQLEDRGRMLAAHQPRTRDRDRLAGAAEPLCPIRRRYGSAGAADRDSEAAYNRERSDFAYLGMWTSTSASPDPDAPSFCHHHRPPVPIPWPPNHLRGRKEAKEFHA